MWNIRSTADAGPVTDTIRPSEAVVVRRPSATARARTARSAPGSPPNRRTKPPGRGTARRRRTPVSTRWRPARPGLVDHGGGGRWRRSRRSTGRLHRGRRIRQGPRERQAGARVTRRCGVPGVRTPPGWRRRRHRSGRARAPRANGRDDSRSVYRATPPTRSAPPSPPVPSSRVPPRPVDKTICQPVVPQRGGGHSVQAAGRGRPRDGTGMRVSDVPRLRDPVTRSGSRDLEWLDPGVTVGVSGSGFPGSSGAPCTTAVNVVGVWWWSAASSWWL